MLTLPVIGAIFYLFCAIMSRGLFGLRRAKRRFRTESSSAVTVLRRDPARGIEEPIVL
jgi:hypothetical protein